MHLGLFSRTPTSSSSLLQGGAINFHNPAMSAAQITVGSGILSHILGRMCNSIGNLVSNPQQLSEVPPFLSFLWLVVKQAHRVS